MLLNYIMALMYRIGVFIGNIDEQYQKAVWKGIVDEACEKKVNIMCFPGLRVNYRGNFEYQSNIVYSLACKKNVDGLIILSNTIFYNLKKSEVLKFYDNYKSIPVINFGITIPGLVNIKVDSDYGIKELAAHLVKIHGYRRFAFIKGPENHQESENRFNVFRRELFKYGINIDDDLIVHGDFLKESGSRAAGIFVDETKKPFDVIVAANDSMAIGAMEHLQGRNMIVPDDAAVAGYDDIEECRSCTPRLTTVHQPIYEKGRQAVSAILEILKGGGTEKNRTIPSSLVIRQSCGCFSNLDDINNDISAKNDSFYEKFPGQKNLAIEECRAPIGLSKNTFRSRREEEWISELFDIYYNSVAAPGTGDFITRLNDFLKTLFYSAIDVYFWHNLVSVFRRHTLKFSLDRNDLIRAECIWEQARIVIDEGYYRAENIKKMNKDKFTENIWQIGNYISSAFDMKKLAGEIEECLKKLDIGYCFFSIYEDDHAAAFPEWSRLMLAIINGSKADTGDNGFRFKTDRLIPQKFLPAGRHRPFIIKPLYFRDERFGLIILEMKELDPLIYDVLRQQISSALKGSRLMDEVNHHARTLENEVARRTEDLTVANIHLKDEIRQKKIMETALKESERSLKSITEATPISLLIAGLKDGRILYSNEPFNTTFGYEMEGVVEKKIFGLCADHDRITQVIRHLKKNESIPDIEMAVFHSDGSVFWVLSSFRTLLFQGKKCFIAGFYDITKRRELEKEILEISDREQSRIGQDLHDDLCQRLAGVAAMITVLENNLKTDKPAESNRAGQISGFINDSIIQTKKLSRGLYPVALESHGLVFGIEELSGRIGSQGSVSCNFYYNKNIEIRDKSIALHLYRITQEAAYNAVRHSGARNIFIKLVSDEDAVSLIIEDDGAGFDTGDGRSNGMGLKIMKYRANMIGGKLMIKSSQNGTSVTCIIKN